MAVLLVVVLAPIRDDDVARAGEDGRLLGRLGRLPVDVGAYVNEVSVKGPNDHIHTQADHHVRALLRGRLPLLGELLQGLLVALVGCLLVLWFVYIV